MERKMCQRFDEGSANHIDNYSIDIEGLYLHLDDDLSLHWMSMDFHPFEF